MQDTIQDFCGQVKRYLSEMGEQAFTAAGGQKLLGDFVRESVFLKELFTKLITDDAFLFARWPAMDPNEITVHRDPGGLFSLRLYIWHPAVTYPIHSHGSWGVVACVAGEIEERKFERLDDGTRVGHATIREINRITLKPGDTTAVLPLNDGVHQMESRTRDLPSVSLHLYGRAVRGGFIELFDLPKETVYRVGPPKYYDRYCAIQTLSAVGEGWCRELLEVAAADKKPLMRLEALSALAKIDRERAVTRLTEEVQMAGEMREEFLKLLKSIR